MPLTISDAQADNVLTLTLAGRLDIATSPALEARLNAAFDAGNRRIVLDLGDTEYVSSAGLRVLLAGLTRLEAAGGRLVLCSLQGYTREVIEVAGLDTVFPVAETLREAEAAARAET